MYVHFVSFSEMACFLLLFAFFLAKYAKEHSGKVEGELDKICKSILDLVDQTLINKATAGESKVRR